MSILPSSNDPAVRHANRRGLTAILGWSATVAFARTLSESLGPLTSAAVVYLISGAVFLVGERWRGRPLAGWRGLPLRYLAGCGGLFVAYTVLLFLAVGRADNRSQVLEVGLVNYLWPALTLWLSLGLVGGCARPGLVPGTLLALAGLVLVMTERGPVSWASVRANVAGNPASYLLALAAALAWALYSNLTRRWGAGNAGGAVGLFLPATGLALLGLSLAAGEKPAWSAGALVEAGGLGLVTAIAYGAWEHAMRRGNLVFITACSYFTPLLSTLVSCLRLGVVPGARLWLGCGLLVAGSLLSWRSVRPPDPR